MKRQATDWDKIFATHQSDKRPVSRKHKQVSKVNSEKTINGTQIWFQCHSSGTRSRKYLISTCQPIDQHLSAASLSPISQLISNWQPLDQPLWAAWLAPVSQLISTCQPLEQLLSATLSTPNQLRYQCLINRAIGVCQPLDHHLSASGTEPTQLGNQRLLSHFISAYSAAQSSPTHQLHQRVLRHAISVCQPLDKRLSAGWSGPVSLTISAY